MTMPQVVEPNARRLGFLRYPVEVQARDVVQVQGLADEQPDWCWARLSILG